MDWNANFRCSILWHNLYICLQKIKRTAMQLIILHSSLETAIALGDKMLDQQIELCDQIIGKIKAGIVDEEVEVYKDCLWWLQMHCNTLDYYRRNLLDEAAEMSYFAERYKPSFITDELIKESHAHIVKA